MQSVAELEVLFGEKFFPAQHEAFLGTRLQADPYLRACLYFPTGKGKTITSLVCVQQQGHDSVLVLAPPRTHPQWVATGVKMGMEVIPISHAKFRQRGYTLVQGQAVIVDEFHLLGGHSGMGWKKMSRLTKALKAPLIIMSATPNYNDAERCFCVASILDPLSTKGGYLEFLYQNCKTEQNPFGMTPNVTGFLHHKDAASFLASLPRVYYIPDEVIYTIDDEYVPGYHNEILDKYGFDPENKVFMSSDMQKRKLVELRNVVDVGGSRIHDHVWVKISQRLRTGNLPMLIFAQRAAIASVLTRDITRAGYQVKLITGATSSQEAHTTIKEFADGKLDILVGTATLATGTDGFDKACDNMLIVNDTEDDAQRRQLVGRILPRGKDTDASRKKVFRLVYH